MSSVTTGRIGKAWAFCFFSSATAAALIGWPAFRMTSPPFETRSAPVSYWVRPVSSQPTVRLTLR